MNSVKITYFTLIAALIVELIAEQYKTVFHVIN